MTKGQPQKLIGGAGGLAPGTPIDAAATAAKSGASTSSVSLTSEANAIASSANLKTPNWRGGQGFTYPSVQWLNTNVWLIPFYSAGDWVSALTGWGASQSVTVVLDNWSCLLNWGFISPTYTAPSVSWTYSYPYYTYLWYGNDISNWGWKTPPQGLVLTDIFGNSLQVTVQIYMNIKTWTPISPSIYDYNWDGSGWGPAGPPGLQQGG